MGVDVVIIFGAFRRVSSRNEFLGIGEPFGVQFPGAVRLDRSIDLQRTGLPRNSMQTVQDAMQNSAVEAEGIAQCIACRLAGDGRLPRAVEPVRVCRQRDARHQQHGQNACCESHHMLPHGVPRSAAHRPARLVRQSDARSTLGRYQRCHVDRCGRLVVALVTSQALRLLRRRRLDPPALRRHLAIAVLPGAWPIGR